MAAEKPIPEPAAMTETENPLLAEWNTPFEAPPFLDISPEHFHPAFDIALIIFRPVPTSAS